MFPNEDHKTFYSLLGLLSASFAKMEYRLSQILSYLIGGEHEVIRETVISNNKLHDNINLIKKINAYREIEPELINGLMIKIKSISEERNLFIHGIWHEPHEKDGQIICLCESKRIRHQVQKKELGGEYSRWLRNEFHSYSIKSFEKRIREVGQIIKIQDELLQKLKMMS